MRTSTILLAFAIGMGLGTWFENSAKQKDIDIAVSKATEKLNAEYAELIDAYKQRVQVNEQ